LSNAFPAGGTQAGSSARGRARTADSLRAFVAIIFAAQLLGAALAIVILANGSSAAAATLGQAVPTSFGVISVDQVETIAATNPDRDTLLPGLKEVQVDVTMTNLLTRPVPYSRDQVRLRVVGSATSIPVSSASIYGGRLRPHSAFRAAFRFDVPTIATHLWLQFRDPGRNAPIRVDLGDRPFPVGLSSAYNPKLHSFAPHGYGGSR
jgi:hypothetical protein